MLFEGWYMSLQVYKKLDACKKATNTTQIVTYLLLIIIIYEASKSLYTTPTNQYTIWILQQKKDTKNKE